MAVVRVVSIIEVVEANAEEIKNTVAESLPWPVLAVSVAELTKEQLEGSLPMDFSQAEGPKFP